MISLGFHSDNWRSLNANFQWVCEEGVASGLNQIEIVVIHGQYFIQALGYDPSVSLESNPRRLRKFLDALDLRVSQIDASYPMMGPEGASYGVPYVQQAIRFAAEIGCPMVVTVDGARPVECRNRDEVFRITCDNYRQVLPWAEDYGVVVNVEPHGPYTTDVEFMLRLFDFFESDHLGLNMDTGNVFIAGLDPLEYLMQMRKYVRHLHIKDVSHDVAHSVRGQVTGIATSFATIGSGANAENIRRCLRYLVETGWDGCASIECCAVQNALRDSIRFLEPIIHPPNGTDTDLAHHSGTAVTGQMSAAPPIGGGVRALGRVQPGIRAIG